MPPVRTEKNRLWTAIGLPNMARPVTASQSAPLVPGDRHSTSLRLLFQDTERLLQDFCKRHEELLAQTGDAVKNAAGVDEALTAQSANIVAEFKNLANTHHLVLRNQLNDISDNVTSLSASFREIKTRLDNVDETVGRKIKDALEIFHKRLDDLDEKQVQLLEGVNDVKGQLDSKVLPILPTMETLPASFEKVLLQMSQQSESTRAFLSEKLDSMSELLKSRPTVAIQSAVPTPALLTSVDAPLMPSSSNVSRLSPLPTESLLTNDSSSPSVPISSSVPRSSSPSQQELPYSRPIAEHSENLSLNIDALNLSDEPFRLDPWTRDRISRAAAPSQNFEVLSRPNKPRLTTTEVRNPFMMSQSSMTPSRPPDLSSSSLTSSSSSLLPASVEPSSESSIPSAERERCDKRSRAKGKKKAQPSQRSRKAAPAQEKKVTPGPQFVGVDVILERSPTNNQSRQKLNVNFGDLDWGVLN